MTQSHTLRRVNFSFDSLIDRMLNSIPSEVWESSSSTFIDPSMSTGHFLNRIIDRLRQYGHTDDNISSRVFGLEASVIPFRIAKNRFSVGTFIQGTIEAEEIQHMKFDVFVGNPPFNSKTDVHFKIMQRVGQLSSDNSYHAFVFPSNIFNRSGDRQRKYTSWLDSTSVIDYGDCSENFPTVADHLSFFVVKKDGLGSFVDKSVPAPIKFSGATRVVGIDFGDCSRTEDETFSVPVFQGLSKTGDKNFRFTTKEAAKKLHHCFGQPVLLINTFGSTVLYDTIAHLEENLQIPWFRQGLEAYVFDDANEARRARDWINSDECKAHIAECMKCGWNMATHIKELF